VKKIAIVGGGIAGLTLANALAQKGVTCFVIEKKLYPFHRVCGEYISNETLPFLKSLDLYPEEFTPPQINRLQLTSVNGKKSDLVLRLGGFGISRYTFDHFLFQKAEKKGVEFFLGTEINSIHFNGMTFELEAENQKFEADLVVGSFGKRSKLDSFLNRNFFSQRSPYVGVKYHVRTKNPDDLISLHNFQDGYCGLSNVEDGKSCLCYLTHRSNLKAYGEIKLMEEKILYRNPFLKDIFLNSTFLFEKPEVINEISFETKRPIENHILMCGDAAGMITPLCGNGMAIAIHSSKILSELIFEFVQGKISRVELEKNYEQEWYSLFARRLWVGRQIQKLFGSVRTSDFAVNLANYAKPIANLLVSKTHGNPF
jgi:menaquinone-9 beta-reductase